MFNAKPARTLDQTPRSIGSGDAGDLLAVNVNEVEKRYIHMVINFTAVA